MKKLQQKSKVVLDPKYKYELAEGEKQFGKFVLVEHVDSKKLAIAYLNDAKKAEAEGRVKIVAEKGSKEYYELLRKGNKDNIQNILESVDNSKMAVSGAGGGR